MYIFTREWKYATKAFLSKFVGFSLQPWLTPYSEKQSPSDPHWWAHRHHGGSFLSNTSHTKASKPSPAHCPLKLLLNKWMLNFLLEFQRYSQCITKQNLLVASKLTFATALTSGLTGKITFFFFFFPLLCYLQILPGLINKQRKQLLGPQLILIVIRDLLNSVKLWQFRAIGPGRAGCLCVPGACDQG